MHNIGVLDAAPAVKLLGLTVIVPIAMALPQLTVKGIE